MIWRREEEYLEGERRGDTHEIERREGDSRCGQERRQHMTKRGEKDTYKTNRREGDS